VDLQRSRLRILLVDDTDEMREMVRGVLEAIGIKRIAEARDGQQALDMIPVFGPHVAFCDWEMKPMNGIEFIQNVRKLPSGTDRFLPIIMLTSYAEEPMVLKARDAGVHEYLTKPFTGQSLIARLDSVINHPRPFIQTENFFGPAPRSAPPK
jgi:CheY-like chemotaxis protein